MNRIDPITPGCGESGSRSLGVRRGARAGRVLLVLLALLLPADRLAALQVPDSVRVPRLVAFGKLWNAVRYLHPWLAYRSIDWDSALVATLPAVRAAGTREEYAAAIQHLLDALDDPVTRVVRDEPAGAASREDPHPSWTWTEDRILVVSITNYADLEDYPGVIARLDTIAARVDSARGVVFDLRRLTPGPAGSLHYAFSSSGIAQRLVGDTITGPGERSRMHSGYRTDTGAGSSEYYSAWQLTDGSVFAPGPGAAWRPVAFIVNGGSEPPAIATALIGAGRATLVAEGGAIDPGTSIRLDMGEGVRVALRLGETVATDGSRAIVPDTVLPESALTRAARDVALGRVRTGGPSKRAAVPLPAIAAPARARAYPEMRSPTLPYRLLAAYRIWGVFAYFNPYQHLIEDEWRTVLDDFVPVFEAAGDPVAYGRAVQSMLARTHDSHVGAAVPWFIDSRSPLPLRMRWIEGRPIVTRAVDEARAAGVHVGDEVVAVDGTPASELIDELKRHAAASTPQGLMVRVLAQLGLGPDSSEVVVTLRGADGATRDVRLTRLLRHAEQLYGGGREGPIFREMPGNIGYADLERLTIPMVDSMFRTFERTDAIVFDMRGYPQGTAWAIAPHLTDRERVPAALFRRPVVTEPRGFSTDSDLAGGMEYAFTQYLPPPRPPYYRGRTVMLIDERAISQSEHTGLFLAAANGTVFIGSPTAGANGDITQFVLPGGIRASFTGHDVRHADGSQLQQVGLRPLILVEPTIRGIREGRDEVLERAVQYLKDGR